MINKLSQITFVYNRYKKASENRKASIEMKITYSYRQKYISTDIMLYPHQWKDGLIINCPDCKQLSKILDTLLTNVRQILYDMMDVGAVNLGSLITSRLRRFPKKLLTSRTRQALWSASFTSTLTSATCVIRRGGAARQDTRGKQDEGQGGDDGLLGQHDGHRQEGVSPGGDSHWPVPCHAALRDEGGWRDTYETQARQHHKGKEEYVLNYFNNRSTNAAAESFNSKIKGLRSQVQGVSELPFFMFRCTKIFG